jgi:signal transduction histidine kinase
MNNKSVYKEPLSTSLGRHLHGNELPTASAISWAAISSLLILLALIVVGLINNNDSQVLVISIGILPILISIWLIRRGMLSFPSSILAVNMILLITWLAATNHGIYDIGVIAYPVILIIAGLILREKIIAYLTAMIILCLGWLVFGDILGLYEPAYATKSYAEDFFIAIAIILIASNSVYLLVRNVLQNLERAEREIEAREKLEKERETLIHELKLKNQELNRFAITVSHDLKTPLITIAGFLGYLEQDALAGNHERMERNIAQINRAARQMGKLVDEILDLSRIGRIMNPPANIPFDDIVQEALKVADALLKTRQVQVRVEAQLPVVHVDRARIVQVIQNLMTNAVKFMGDQKNPLVEIGMDEISGKQVFFMRDNGIGIKPEYQEKVFELFNKLDPNTEGTGIGLALVKRIIEVHSGKIWVQSELGHGTTCYFTLGDKMIKETS